MKTIARLFLFFFALNCFGMLPIPMNPGRTSSSAGGKIEVKQLSPTYLGSGPERLATFGSIASIISLFISMWVLWKLWIIQKEVTFLYRASGIASQLFEQSSALQSACNFDDLQVEQLENLLNDADSSLQSLIEMAPARVRLHATSAIQRIKDSADEHPREKESLRQISYIFRTVANEINNHLENRKIRIS